GFLTYWKALVCSLPLLAFYLFLKHNRRHKIYAI
ncbi:unnamed protein product, partial [Gulo gulo]